MSAEVVEVEVLSPGGVVPSVDAAGHRRVGTTDQAGSTSQQPPMHKGNSYSDPFAFDPTGNALYTQDQHPICKSRMRRLDALPPLKAPVDVAKKRTAG